MRRRDFIKLIAGAGPLGHNGRRRASVEDGEYIRRAARPHRSLSLSVLAGTDPRRSRLRANPSILISHCRTFGYGRTMKSHAREKLGSTRHRNVDTYG
jgi:hypothetical protein